MEPVGILQSAAAAYRDGHLPETEQLCRMILDRSLDARLLLGMTLCQLGRLEESAEQLRAVTAITPGSFEAHHWLSVVLRRMGHAHEALASARVAAAIRPSDGEAHNKLGQALLVAGQPDEALAEFEIARKLLPANASVQLNSAAALMALELNEAAETQLRRVTAIAPEWVQPRLVLAKFLIGRGRGDEAVTPLEEALRIEPDSAELHLQLAHALILRARELSTPPETEAIEGHLRTVILLEPGNAAAYGLLGFEALTRGRFKDAEVLIGRSLELEPNQGVGYSSIVHNRTVTPEDEPLIARMESVALQSALDRRERVLLHYALGKSHADLGRFKTAMSHYDEANRISLESLKPFDKDAYAEQVDRTISLYRRLPTRPTPDDRRPVFIVGVMRSGTTLVEQTVSSHPEVAGGGELGFWLDRTTELVEGLDPGSLRAGYSAELARAGRGSALVTDKMPHNYELLGPIHLAFPEARFIYVKRDPIDTCLSIYTTPFHNPPGFGHDKASIAFFYREHLRLMAHWRSVLPADSLLEISYEELVADQEGTTRRMIEFLGLAWDEACLHHEQNVRPIYTSSMWQARQPVYRSSVGRWKRFEPWLGELLELKGL